MHRSSPLLLSLAALFVWASCEGEQPGAPCEGSQCHGLTGGAGGAGAFAAGGGAASSSDAGLDAAGDGGAAPSDAGPDAQGGSGGGGASGGGSPCVSGEWQGSFTVSVAEQSLRVPLNLTPNVDYTLLTLSFRYTPAAWSPTCYNPAASNPQGFPAFESWVALKRGSHWCKGGSLFETTFHGPAPGYGASNKAIAETYYKDEVWTGSGCGSTDVEADIFNEPHSIAIGTTYDAVVVLDATAGTLTADTGADVHTGPVDPAARLVTSDASNDGWYVVFSFDGGFKECYNDQGFEDPTAPCCWLPSIGWTYENLHWEACP